MEACLQTPVSKQTRLLPKVSDVFSPVTKYLLFLLLLFDIFFWGAKLLYFAWLFRFSPWPDTEKFVDCILLVTPVGFFSLAYLFRSNERVGKGIGLANPTTFQAETPRKQ